MSGAKTAAVAERSGPAETSAEQPAERPGPERSGPERSGAERRRESPGTRPRSLWRNRPFQTLWIGTSTSTLGVSVADIAYPLTILAITHSPALAGLFAAVQGLGMLLAGLPAGVLADRYHGRTIVILTEAARAAVTAVLAVALIAGWLSLPLLFTAAALLGAGQVIRNAAGLLLMRSVVPPEQLTQALTQDEVQDERLRAGRACARRGTLRDPRAGARHTVPFHRGLFPGRACDRGAHEEAGWPAQ